jgi:hypothetical protein|tara:strand:+ start:597 stop:722 length:126 start_codon:yes stop_codon:yes gene_type:complete
MAGFLAASQVAQHVSKFIAIHCAIVIEVYVAGTAQTLKELK